VINRLTEIAREHYQRAATKALEAGFDGIEVVISPGSLIDHLLRSDIYRFSEAANRESYFDRFRLLSEVIRAVHQVWNLRQIGVRFSSLTNGAIAQEHTADALLKYVVYRLNDYGLSFVHLSEADSDASSVAAALRPYYDGILIGRGDYTRDSAARAIESGHVDLVSLPDA
jgi:2,4-dienoyl-CoA reductase-like NADH-dependent reductase (Old Yellow Enzyme family)